MSASDRAYKDARRLRRQLSVPEKLLWVRLRGSTVRVRRQHPVGSYILDFYCPAAKLAIEVDGAMHDFGDRPQRHERRTEWLKVRGMGLLRIPAREVLADPDHVAESILRLCAEPLHHSPPVSGPPPHELRSQGGARERARALPMHLVDVKVCSVDDTWSRLKLVIRKSHLERGNSS